MKYRYFIRLMYNGKNYHGWQSQNNASSVQDIVEKALTTILRENVKITGCGRTDAGVHAKDYYANFDLNKDLINEYLDKLVFKLNQFLPLDIAIKKIYKVSDNAHARFDALSRTYEYTISREKTAFNYDLSYFLYGKLNIEEMRKASAILSEYDDFTSFSKVDTDVNNNICKIFLAEWIENNNELVFRISANRFLRNMVRAIVGTILDVGKGNISIIDFRRIIESKNRCNAGYSVPACGLALVSIVYPEEIFIC